MTSKQRAYLKGLAMTIEPIFQLGKASLTPENTKAINEALEARELIKINVLQNCTDNPKELAVMIAERTHSQVVQVIGKKIVLYKQKTKTKKKTKSETINKVKNGINNKNNIKNTSNNSKGNIKSKAKNGIKSNVKNKTNVYTKNTASGKKKQTKKYI